MTAYLLGVRHGFDADHVAVVDDATRLLMQRGKRPVATGMWFALGHAGVVVVLAMAVAFVAGPAAQRWVEQVGGRVGLWVSLPLLFAAGMCTVDSIDGMLMSRAYTWSLTRPLRRLWVNVTTTTLTVVLAAVVSVVVLTGVLEELGAAGLAPVAALGDHFELLGYLTLATFMAVWGGAALWWRFSGAERRTAGARTG